VQAQLPAAANLAFWNRTSKCTTEGLEQARLKRRTLVRFWGQRNTVHMYAAKDWPFLHASLAERQSVMHARLKKAGLLSDFLRVARRAEKRLEQGEQLTYKDIKSRKLERAQDKWVLSYAVFMLLVREGVVCHGPDRGNESTFVHRKHWLPRLDWSPPDPERAQAELARRYLSAYGPAEARDLAFWYGTTVTSAKRWIEAAKEHCAGITVGDRGYWCCREDLDEMMTKPPPAGSWPVRLLYRFDPLVLATKDKSWLVDDEHYKKVWRPSAHVEAVLLVRGRIAGTWRYERRTKSVRIRVVPFTKPGRAVARAAEVQAAAVARFIGLELDDFEIAAPGATP